MSKVTNIRSEEELVELKARRLKRGLTTIAVVAVGAGLYGFKLGRKAGYTRGVKDGYIAAGKELLDGWSQITDAMNQSRIALTKDVKKLKEHVSVINEELFMTEDGVE